MGPDNFIVKVRGSGKSVIVRVYSRVPFVLLINVLDTEQSLL